VLCAAGYNLKWLLRMIAKKGVTFLEHLFLRLLGRAFEAGVHTAQAQMMAPQRGWACLTQAHASVSLPRLVLNAVF
jgi:hypothetical protein